MPTKSQIPPESNGAASGADAGAHDDRIAPKGFVARLIQGIIADIQQLIRQQLAMFREEIQDEFRKAWQSAAALAAGAVITLVGSVMLLVMLPLLLNWLVPELPLWACFGIVGGPLAAAGGVCVFVAVKRIQSCHPLTNPAVEAFKENLKWSVNPK